MIAKTKKGILLLLCAALLTGLLAPVAARAQAAQQKVVRVGWFDSSFCYWDRFGRRCGIDYEYQRKISAYTGWTYEYVEDSWPNLFQMLKDGEIDLLSDVSFKPERLEHMLFPDLAMGMESYYIYIDGENQEITADNPASFDGRRIGVNQGSVQEGFLRDWAAKNGVTLEVIPLTADEDESLKMVTRGEIDGFASIYSFSAEQKVTPVCRIGASEYFYAVNRSRPDLLAELNMALANIQDEDPTFNQRLSEERLYNTRTNAYLSPSQEDWIQAHGAIRVGYRADYLPFCQLDRETGELTGALKDYLAHAANNLRSTEIRFEAIPYPTTGAAMEAMKAGEVDCVFPVNLHSYDADQMAVRLTNPAMMAGMNAVMRASEHQAVSRETEMTFALNAGNLNTETFIREQFPDGIIKTYEDARACYAAVASGEADCFLVPNYRIPEAEETLEKHRLLSVPTGEHMHFSFAVNQSDPELYFLLNKTVLMTRSEDMDSALASYMYANRRVSFSQFMKDNWIAVVAALTAVFAVIVALLLQRLKAVRQAAEQQRLLEEAAEIVKLKQTITSLLDNMPGMNFTKDAKAGVYLACNQAFAAFARKKRPEDVIGRTDAELFDAETAARFAEDDRMALSMEEPYIYFEDVPDADGSLRQFKNTRLKYTDDVGRLCVLGVLLDVTTDTVHIHRENVSSKEDYEKARGAGIIYAHIAQALARGYADLYYVNLDTEQYIEYRTDDETGLLNEVRRGWHFFEGLQEDAEKMVYPDDQDAVIRAMDRRTLVKALERNKVFVMTYRLVSEAGPVYARMKVSRMKDDDRYIILGVTDVDEEMKQRNAAARMQEEEIAYNRLIALAGEFLGVYLVDPKTGRYREFSASTEYDTLARAKEGADFFTASREAALNAIFPEDLNRFMSVFTRENVMAEIERSGSFTLSYRLMMRGRLRYVQLKMAMVEEAEGPRLIVGVSDIDAQVRQEEDYVRHMARAQKEVNIDTLTGVKSRHAYLVAEERLNAQIQEGRAPEFAIVILDVNDLKKVNDSEGHKAGDRYLRDACRIVCNTFKHSPVFRVGGDEFTVVAQGEDYTQIDALMRSMDEHNARALRDGGIVIACGMARREGDASVAQVFERADQVMYDNKSELKSRRKRP